MAYQLKHSSIEKQHQLLDVVIEAKIFLFKDIKPMTLYTSTHGLRRALNRLIYEKN